VIVLDHPLIQGRPDASKSVAHRSKSERMDFYTKSCNVLLLKFARKVAFHEGGLSKFVRNQVLRGESGNS
jgi:hypothetical protein